MSHSAWPGGFCEPAQPPLTIGIVTFSGGVLMDEVANLPANQTTVCGAFNCPGYAPAITITFASPVRDFSVDVYNGDIVNVSYTVASGSGGSVTKSLAANFFSGSDTFALPDAGITSVTIQRATPDSFWDSFIDNVRFLALPTTVAECKHGGWEGHGVFKNQGDCVGWVATHGRNEPAGP